MLPYQLIAIVSFIIVFGSWQVQVSFFGTFWKFKRHIWDPQMLESVDMGPVDEEDNRNPLILVCYFMVMFDGVSVKKLESEGLVPL